MRSWAVIARRAALVATAATLAGLSAALPSSAAPAIAQDTAEIDSLIVDRTLLVTAGTESSMAIAPAPGVGRGRAISCGWFRLDTSTVDVDVYQLHDPEIGSTYLLWCWYADDRESLPGHPIVSTYTGPGIPGEPVDVDEVSEFALASMDFVEPVAVLNPPNTQIVGVESWLAVTSPLDYDAIHANAGPVWVSVRPQFRSVTWDLGNGDEVTCTASSGATTVWVPGRAEQSSACVYTYATSAGSSDGDGTHRVSATVTWTIERRTFAQDRWVPWRDFSLTTTQPVRVIEIQAAID